MGHTIVAGFQRESAQMLYRLTLTADRLDLYHIWTPTVKVRFF